MKKYITYIGIAIGLLLISSLIINAFYYYELFSNNIYKIVLTFTNSIIIGLLSYFIGKSTKEKGYKEGLVFGVIIIIVLFVLSLILFQNVTLNMLVYYPILLLASVIGAMIGINRKKN